MIDKPIIDEKTDEAVTNLYQWAHTVTDAINAQEAEIFELQEKATGAVINMQVFQQQLTKLHEWVEALEDEAEKGTKPIPPTGHWVCKNCGHDFGKLLFEGVGCCPEYKPVVVPYPAPSEQKPTFDGNADNVTKNWNLRHIEDELRDEIDTLKETNRQLRAEITKLHKQYQGAISYLQDKRDELKAENERQHQDCDRAAAKVDDLCKEREKLRSEIEQLKRTFHEQEAEIDKQMKGRRVTEAELMAAKAQIEQDVAEVEELQKENGELMTALEAANAKIERVKQWADRVPLGIAKAEVLAALGEVKK